MQEYHNERSDWVNKLYAHLDVQVEAAVDSLSTKYDDINLDSDQYDENDVEWPDGEVRYTVKY